MGKFLQLVFIMLFASLATFAQVGEIQGRVTDSMTGEGIPFANVTTTVGGALTGAQTDFDGFYSIKPVTPGQYDVEISYVGYQKNITQGVLASADQITFLNIELVEESQVLEEVVVKAYKVPLLKADETSTGSTVTKEDIENLPTRNVQSIASTSSGVYQADEGDDVNVKGSRDDATVYFIDGIKVRGLKALPASAIEQMNVVTGGVPARYGDATGGIINITTRGPQNQFTGGLELISSVFEPYGYLLAGANLSGPLVRIKKGTPEERPLLGFFASLEYQREKDDDPSAIGTWTLTDEALESIRTEPLRRAGNSAGFLRNAEFLTKDDMQLVDVKPDIESETIRSTLKLDFQPATNITVQVGGSAVFDDRQNWDGNGAAWDDRRSMLSSTNNTHRGRQNVRGFVRFVQRFNSRVPSEGEEETASWLSNAFYTVQLDYTNYQRQQEDPFHEDRIFDYGYVGKFITERGPNYGNVSLKPDYNLEGIAYLGDSDQRVRYEPGDVNPYLVNHNNQYFELAGDDLSLQSNVFQIQANQGLLNGQQPAHVYSMYYSPGFRYDLLFKEYQDQYRVSFNSSVDIKKPGSTDRNKHALEFGFEYEQRVDREYRVEPVEIWNLMRQTVNDHIVLDEDNPRLLIDGNLYTIPEYESSGLTFGVNDTIMYEYESVGDQRFFDKNLRDKLGLGMTDWIDVEALDRSLFSLDMFSVDELFRDGNNELTRYFGYDYLGNRITDEPAFADFWTEKDEFGNFTRPIGSFRPIYVAGYIQDKFAFKDLIFNVGVRVDRFDANQKVLRDPYSLYAVRTVEEVDGSKNPALGQHPSTVANDAVVYVDDEVNGNVIKGYRDGDQWYNAEGTAIADPTIIASSGAVLPYLKNPLTDNPKNDIKSENFDPDTAFEDYSPQLSVMPRIAFSFNISDEAIFFAHYDVLTQRPTDRLESTPFFYYFFQERAIDRVFNNPNLKPARTVDYQVGFKQKLTRTSALTISAFYRELKDMVQVTNIANAYPRSYLTFGNEDFGTVKGFEFAYDLRRTGNIKLTANYTLQFAEGTGSADDGAFDAIRFGQPNLKNIVPFNYDSRHLLSVVMDYRYGEGNKYNGPRIGNLDLLANAGLNIIMRARSGEPYSRQANPAPEAVFGLNRGPTLEGAINGSRLPWNLKFDARIDKDFKLAFGKNKGKSAKYLNVYLQVLNVLDTDNIINVYTYTGSPSDDGYVSSALGQEEVSAQVSPESYLDYYNAKIADPDNFSLPRRMRLGALLNF